MLEPEPIIFEERREVYAQNDWPKMITISPGAIMPPVMTVNNEGQIIIKVANGGAIYKLSKTQNSAFGFNFDLVDGNWLPLKDE